MVVVVVVVVVFLRVDTPLTLSVCEGVLVWRPPLVVMGSTGAILGFGVGDGVIDEVGIAVGYGDVFGTSGRGGMIRDIRAVMP